MVLDDLMWDESTGSYVCAMWCEEGRVEARGDVCDTCSIEMATSKVWNCLMEWYEAMMDGDRLLLDINEFELVEAIEDRALVIDEVKNKKRKEHSEHALQEQGSQESG